MLTPSIYARYSSDNQRETSIDDQFRVGLIRIEREGWPAPLKFSDSEISAGTPTLLRAGGRALMMAIRAGQIDVLIIESLDRCWRDIVDQERTVREIERRGVRIIGLFDGYDSAREGRELERIIKGGMNQQYLRDLAKKTHRGLSGQVSRGLFAGGLPYGYRSIDAPGGHRLEPHPDQAPWVLWIFQQFSGGMSARAIAHQLNTRRIPSPRGGTWALSAVHGHAKYQTGILRNPIYAGRYIWNKSRWVKDPDTGKRARIERDETEWQTLDLPELRIIEDDLWRAVQSRLRGPSARGKGRPVRSPWSGLLRCGHCGGPLIVADVRAYACGRHKDRGPTVCPGMRVHRRVLEPRLLEITREHLLGEDSIAALRAEVARLAREHAGTAGSRSTVARKRLAELNGEINRLTDAIVAAPWSEAILARLKSAEAERTNLTAELSTYQAAPTAEIIPGLMDRYRAKLADLPAALANEPDKARDALRELIGEVTVIKEGEDLWAELPAYGGGMLLNVVAGGRYSIKKHRYRIA